MHNTKESGLLQPLTNSATQRETHIAILKIAEKKVKKNPKKMVSVPAIIGSGL